MALTEHQRTEIYSNLCDTVGQPQAEYLMAQQPPGGWEQLATKRDLADLETRTQASLVEMQFATKRDLADLETRTQASLLELKSSLVETQSSVVALEAKTDVQFSELRGQLAMQFAAVDTRFGELSGQRARDVWAFAAAMTVMTVSVCCSIFVAVWQLAPS